MNRINIPYTKPSQHNKKSNPRSRFDKSYLGDTLKNYGHDTASVFSGAANSASHAGNSAIDKIKSEGSSLVNSLTHGVSGAVGDIETILIVAAIGIAFLLFKGGETVYHGAQEGAQFIKDNGATIAKDAVQLAPLALL